MITNNYPCINHDELCKLVGISLVGHKLESVAKEPLSSYWTRYGPQLVIPIFNTTDANKCSIQEVASYAQKVVDDYNLNTNTSNKMRTYIRLFH